MGSKASTPAAPDYSSLAASDTQAAQIQAQTSTDQLNWAKQQYADQAPYTNAYMTSMTNNMDAETQQAQLSQQQYQNVYQPLETQFAQQAANYNSADQSAQASGAAEADVANSFASQRSASLSSLESYGIDPSQTRYGALDLGTRVSQAAAQAGAGTQSRLQSQATGMGLESTAIGQGMGVANNATSNFAGSSSSGSAGVNAGLSTSNTYGNLMGTANQWANTGNSALGNAGGLASAQGNYGIGTMQANATQSAGIGSLVGGLAVAGTTAAIAI